MMFFKSFGFVLLCTVLAIIFAFISLVAALVFFVIGSIAAVEYSNSKNTTTVRLK